MRWFGYLWTVAVNCFYVFIILIVFDKLNHRPEAVTVAVLGLLYVTIRTIGIGQYISLIHGLFGLNKQILYVRSLLNDPSYETEVESFREYEKDRDQSFVKIYINAAFLSLISLICLLALWSELSRN